MYNNVSRIECVCVRVCVCVRACTAAANIDDLNTGPPCKQSYSFRMLADIKCLLYRSFVYQSNSSISASALNLYICLPKKTKKCHPCGVEHTYGQLYRDFPQGCILRHSANAEDTYSTWETSHKSQSSPYGSLQRVLQLTTRK